MRMDIFDEFLRRMPIVLIVMHYWVDVFMAHFGNSFSIVKKKLFQVKLMQMDTYLLLSIFSSEFEFYDFLFHTKQKHTQTQSHKFSKIHNFYHNKCLNDTEYWL